MMSEVLAQARVGLAEQISAHFLPRLLHLQRRGSGRAKRGADNPDFT